MGQKWFEKIVKWFNLKISAGAVSGFREHVEKKAPAHAGFPGGRATAPVVPSREKSGAERLVYAVSEKEISRLLQQGIDINVYAPDKEVPGWCYTALLEACKNNNTTKAQLLINSGADVNLPAKNGTQTGKSPLMFVIEKNNFKLAELLLKSGANMDYKDDTGQTVWNMPGPNSAGERWLKDYQLCQLRKQFYEAAVQGDVSYVQAHITEAGVSAKQKAFVYTPSVEVAALLHQSGVDVNTADTGHKKEQVYYGNWSYPALAVACKENWEKKVLWLLERGANVNRCWYKQEVVAGMANVDEEYEVTPLMWCVKNKNLPLAEKLIYAGADINIKGRLGPANSGEITALTLLCQYAGADAADAWLKHVTSLE